MYVTFEDIRTFGVVGRAIVGEAEADGSEVPLGSLHDVYVDTRDWRITWLVLEAGSWLASNRVLIGTDHRVAFDVPGRRLVTDLTRYDLETAESASSVRTLSDQHSGEVNRRGDGDVLPTDRSGGVSAGIGAADTALGPDAGALPPSEEERHLQSASELVGYVVSGRDAEVGPVTDLLIDTDSPAVAWLSVGTGSWLAGREVVIRPEWTAEVSWSERRVSVELSREQVRDAPPLDGLEGLDRAYASALARFYRFPIR